MFNLSTRTSWQKTPTKISLMDMKEAISPYPLVERKFFDDIVAFTRKYNHYFVEMGLLNVVGETKKTLDPDFWILIWALDFKDRSFQILIEKHPNYQGKGAIAGVGPSDLLDFFSSMKQNAILPTLSLINNPEKMKSVAVIVSRPKNYNEKSKERNSYQALGRFQKWINDLKDTPNKEGKWFPSNAPTCPNCNSPIVGIQDNYKVGFGFLVCPNCGYSKREQILKKRPF